MEFKEERSKLLQTFLSSFEAMPRWLKSALIVTLIIGIFYYGFIRKQIIYSAEKAKTEQLYSEVSRINTKIAKLEDVREVTEDIIFTIEEVRSIANALEEYHVTQVDILMETLEEVLTPSEYQTMCKKLNETDIQHRKRLNELFAERAKKHISVTLPEMEK